MFASKNLPSFLPFFSLLPFSAACPWPGGSVIRFPLSPSPAALMTRIDAELTRVKHKFFVCHSYEKHPGWGAPRRFALFLYPTPPFRYNPLLASIEENA